MSDAEFLSALRDNARTVVADHCTGPGLHRFIDQTTEGLDRSLWTTAAELGWLTLAIPEACGGLGVGTAETAALQQELGRAVAPIPYLSTILVQKALALWPSSAPGAAFFPALGTGEMIAAAGPIGSSALTAERVGDGKVRISGTCAPILDGAIADLFLLPVGEPGGLVLVRRATGLTTEALPVADRTRSVARLRCNGVEVSEDHVLLGSGAEDLGKVLADEARILIANDAIGGADATLEKTVEYLKARVQFGKPIGSFQALKHRCADHKIRIEAARLLVETAARTEDRALWASLAKFAACDAYAMVAADSVQLHGGIGFTWEHDAHLYLKRALLNQLLFGTSAEEQDRSAALLLAMENER
jgi:alkylation response protein AidB-like acyl-CoA dehydrogenase